MENDSKFWLGIWVIVAITLISIVSIVSDSNAKQNTALAAAQTCEAAVLIHGGTDVTARLTICQIQKVQEYATAE